MMEENRKAYEGLYIWDIILCNNGYKNGDKTIFFLEMAKNLYPKKKDQINQAISIIKERVVETDNGYIKNKDIDIVQELEEIKASYLKQVARINIALEALQGKIEQKK